MEIRKILYGCPLLFGVMQGWSGGANVSCILPHRDVQLILAYSWARPASLVADKGRGGIFYIFCFFTFIPVPLSSLFLSFISSISFLLFSGRRHKMTHKGCRIVKPQHNQWSHVILYLWGIYSPIEAALSELHG